jgi:hypothetical protein
MMSQKSAYAIGLRQHQLTSKYTPPVDLGMEMKSVIVKQVTNVVDKDESLQSPVRKKSTEFHTVKDNPQAKMYGQSTSVHTKMGSGRPEMRHGPNLRTDETKTSADQMNTIKRFGKMRRRRKGRAGIKPLVIRTGSDLGQSEARKGDETECDLWL